MTNIFAFFGNTQAKFVTLRKVFPLSRHVVTSDEVSFSFSFGCVLWWKESGCEREVFVCVCVRESVCESVCV